MLHIECLKCHLVWEPPCEQTNCIELFGECVVCHFVKPGLINRHGSGTGVAEELVQIACPPITLDRAKKILTIIRSNTDESRN